MEVPSQMTKKLKVKKRMTGPELARLLSKSRLPWNNGSVIRSLNDGTGRYSYCMIGQIARKAGVTNETLKELGEGEAPSEIPELNDACGSKEECVQKFCNMERETGEYSLPIKSWIDEMLRYQREREREERE
jgi:hypothetical protein